MVVVLFTYNCFFWQFLGTSNKNRLVKYAMLIWRDRDPRRKTSTSFVRGRSGALLFSSSSSCARVLLEVEINLFRVFTLVFFVWVTHFTKMS